MTAARLLEEARKLSVDERIEFAQALWDEIAEHHAVEIPVTDEQRELLRERLASAEENPEAFEAWDEVRARISDKM